MKKRIFAFIILAVFSAAGLSSCALAENCQASCNHLYGFEKRREATCKSEGAVYHECIKCHYTEVLQTIPKTEHDFSNPVWLKQGGCLGYRNKALCSFCGEANNLNEYYGSFTNTYYCYIHDYDFENPVSVTADENDPDCVLYEYRCKNPDCRDDAATILIHGWNGELRSWYEENKDCGETKNEHYYCPTCLRFANAYVFAGFDEDYALIKAPESADDYALVGFRITGQTYGRCVKLSYDEYNRFLAGEKINFPMPEFI